MFKKLGIYGLISLIFITACLIILSWLLAPVLEKYRPVVQDKVSQLIEMPVVIQQMHIAWYRYQPDISLDDVTIFDKETHSPILQIKQVHVLFSLPKSLWQRKPVISGIVVSGSAIHVDEAPNGDLIIHGFPAIEGLKGKPYTEETKFTEMLRSLLKLPALMLNDVDVSFFGHSGIKRFVSLDHLKFQNNGAQHEIVGKALLRQALSTKVTLQVKWVGDVLDLDEMKAEIYLQAANLSLSEWWKGHTWRGFSLDQGDLTTTIWATWNHGRFERVQSQVDLRGLELIASRDQAVHAITRIRGNLDFKQSDEVATYVGEHLKIEMPSHTWPETHFYLTVTPHEQAKKAAIALQVGALNVGDVRTLLLAAETPLPENFLKALVDLQIAGHLEEATFLAKTVPLSLSSVSLQMRFKEVTFNAFNHAPGMSGLTGTLTWDGAHGELTLPGAPITVTYDSLFDAPIMLKRCAGNLFLQQDETKDWVLHLKNIEVNNADLAGKAEGMFLISAHRPSVFADLKASFSVENAARITHYLPMQTFSASLAAWLKQAFLSGSVSHGTVLLHGPLNAFPFKRGEGVFRIAGYANQVDLRFASSWPVLQHVHGELVFDKQRMDVAVDDARLLDMNIQHAVGVIADLDAIPSPVLTVSSNTVSTDFSHALALIQQSSLASTLGKRLHDLKMQGPITLNVSLNVPLNQPDNTTVAGKINFKDSVLALVPWHLTLNQLTGEVRFTEKTIQTNDIQGQLFNQPIHLLLITPPKTKDTLRAILTGPLSLADLSAWLHLPLETVATGDVNMKAAVTIVANQDTTVNLQSNLVGATLNLPGAYAKAKTVARPFAANMTLSDNKHAPFRVTMQYADLLTLAITLQSVQDPLKGIVGIEFTNALGTMNLQLAPKTDGFNVQSLNLQAPAFTLTATGEIAAKETHLEGSADSPNLSRALSHYGLNAHNFVASTAHSTFDLTWKTPPMLPTLSDVSGTIGIRLGKGQITELSGSTNAKMDLGRMLSLFSLQTIPRRLTLDFSDLFQQGYSFDIVKGDFKLSHGDAETNNTYLDGPVARVNIRGRIGLTKEDYDLKLGVMPHVTSSIPVAATLLTGQPVIGIAAWALDKVISPSVSKVTVYKYVVTGPWNNPAWKKANAS